MAIIPAPFYLTRLASRQLQEIEVYSRKLWGEAKAKAYIKALYAVMKKAAHDPSLGKLRKVRSFPFLMIPAEKHFVVYELFGKGIMILCFLHQHQDVETFIETMKPEFLVEIEAIKKEIAGKKF